MDLYNTPTFYINGRQVIGERPFDYFKKIIDEELNQAGGNRMKRLACVDGSQCSSCRSAGLPAAGAASGTSRFPCRTRRPRRKLGKKLFFDRRLSGDGTMSCATCHDPEQGYSDGLEISLNYPTTRNWRNSPTLINVAFQQHLFHDGRAATLEEQALFPMMSAFEMNQNLDFMEEEIRAVPEYVAEFTEVFGDGDVTGAYCHGDCRIRADAHFTRCPA
jgi:cytochrome c peroxidase